MHLVRKPVRQLAIDWYKVFGGGGTSTGSTHQVTGTLGQADAGGAMAGGNYSLTGDFWSLISAVQMVVLLLLTFTRARNSVSISWPNTGSYTLQQNSEVAMTNWVTSGYTVPTPDGTAVPPLPRARGRYSSG